MLLRCLCVGIRDQTVVQLLVGTDLGWHRSSWTLVGTLYWDPGWSPVWLNMDRHCSCGDYPNNIDILAKYMWVKRETERLVTCGHLTALTPNI